MNMSAGNRAFWVGLLLVPAMLVGCGPKDQSATQTKSTIGEELGLTVGSVADVLRPEPLGLEGYGLVGGLSGTGSPSCPPQIRAYLKQYILAQMPNGSVSPDDLIDSRDTAVVHLEAMAPAACFRSERFDVRVTPVRGSDTTSLHGGWLYKADLKMAGTFGVSARTLAAVEGPVFVNLIAVSEPDPLTGYVLGGAAAQYDFVGTIRLRRPDFAMASAIRNRLNERYQEDMARAVSPTNVDFVIPSQYQGRKIRFVSMVAATFLAESPELTATRVDTLTKELVTSEDKEPFEIALEAVGRESLSRLRPLFEAPDEEVRLRAARCALYLRDDAAIGPLRTIALDEASAYRLDALDAMVSGARRNDAVSLARRLLRDPDVRVVLAAYEALRRFDDIAVRREYIGRSFYLESIVQTDRKAIFVARSGEPRIVLFGVPLNCHDDIFVEAANGTVMVNSLAGQNYVSVTRKDPARPRAVGTVRTGFSISEIVRVLGAERQRTADGQLSGLGAPYTEVTAVLEQLCAKAAVTAEFWAGPLPKIGRIVKE